MSSVDSFSVFLNSEDPEITRRALGAMSKIQHQNFIPTFTTFLAHTDSAIRLTAIEALGQTFHKDAAPPLRSFIESSSPSAFRAAAVQAFCKVATADDLDLLEKLIAENTHANLGYDLGAAARRLPELEKLAKPLKRLWSTLLAESKAGYIFFLTRLKPDQIAEFKSILTSEFEQRKNSTDVKKSIIAGDLLLLLNRIKIDAKSFLTTHYNPRAPWRVLRGYLQMIRANPKGQNASSRILDLLSSADLHPYIRSYILDNLERFSPSIEVYSYLLLNESAANYNAIAKAYPDQTIRYFSSHFAIASAYDKKLLLRALFKTKNTTSLKKAAALFPDMELASQSEFVRLATQAPIFSDSMYIEILKMNDLAMSSYVSAYAKKNKKNTFVPQLKATFEAMSEETDTETMAQILADLFELEKENLSDWASQMAQRTQSPILLKGLQKLAPNETFTASQVKKKSYPYEAILANTARFIEIVMNEGRIKIELNPSIAPLASYNIVSLANRKFYNGIAFHRVVKNFVAQAGDPRGDGWGGPNYSIPCEYTPARYRYGAVGMATAGKDTGSSQFFIMQRYTPHLDGKYTLFGRVVEGFDVLENLTEGTSIYSVNVL